MLLGFFALAGCASAEEPEPLETSLDDGVVPNHGAAQESPAYWQGLVRLSTDGFLHRLTETGATTEPYPLTYAQARFAPPWGSETAGPILSGVDGCWTRASPSTWPTTSDVGATVALGVGEHEIVLDKETSDLGAEYWWYSEDHPRSAFTQDAGLTLRFGGETSGVVIPPELVLTNIETLYEDYLVAGDLHLTWEPSEVPGAVVTVFNDHRPAEMGEAPPDGSRFCVLADDGEAHLSFGAEARQFERLFTAREVAQELMSESYGRVYLSAHASTQVVWE